MGRRKVAESGGGRRVNNAAATPTRAKPDPAWSGAAYLGRRRVVFLGKAGTARNQKIHAVKLCIALAGDFELSIEGGVQNRSCSAVVINAGVTHTIECPRSENADGKSAIILAYILPETQTARDLRAEYLYDGRGKFYDIPQKLVDEALPLRQILKEHETWDCHEAFAACDEIITGLGTIRARQFSTSLDLTNALDKDVRSAIRHIYDTAEDRSPGAKIDEIKCDRSLFREQTGISIEKFSIDVQMLIALRLYADEVQAIEKGSPEEKRLMKELDDPGLTAEQRAKLNAQIDKLPHRVSLAKIADKRGISHSLLTQRNTAKLGIPLAQMRERTVFYTCPGK